MIDSRTIVGIVTTAAFLITVTSGMAQSPRDINKNLSQISNRSSYDLHSLLHPQPTPFAETTMHDGLRGQVVPPGNIAIRHVLSPITPQNNEWVMSEEVMQNWNDTASAWINSNKTLFSYDGAGRETGWLQQYWSSSAWVNQMKISYTYNSNGLEIEEVGQSWQDDTWKNGSKHVYVYDTGGRVTEELDQTWSDSAWVNSDQTIYTYNEDGNETAYLTQTWNGQSWMNVLQYTYAYDSIGHETESLYHTWSGSAWKTPRRYVFEYDGDGNKTEYLAQNWNDTGWINARMDKYAYDVKGNEIKDSIESWSDTGWVVGQILTLSYGMNGALIEYLVKDWDGTGWITTIQNTFDYDGNGRKIREMWRGGFQLWEMGADSLEFAYTYDANGNQDEGIVYAWHGTTSTKSSRGLYTWTLVTYVEEHPPVVLDYALFNNYPNPFNPVTTIHYALPVESKVSLKIYNVLGQEVKTLIDKNETAGTRSVEWDASSIASGVYFYRLDATAVSDPGKHFSQVRKMIVIK